MSLTLITAMTSLRVLVGVVGVGYSLYANKDNEGQFAIGKIPEAILGETVGGLFADWLKEGRDAGYEKFLKRLDAIDPEALNHDLQKAARKATLLATHLACQACLADIKSERYSIWKRVKNIAWKNEEINWLVAVSKSLKHELENIETAQFDERINYRELFNIFDRDNIANSAEDQKTLADKLKAQTLADIKNESYAKFGGQINVPFSSAAFGLLSEAVLNGWDVFPQDRDYTIQLKLTAGGAQVKRYDWFHLVCVIFNEEYKVNEKIEAALQKQTALEQTALLKQIAEFGRLENLQEIESRIKDFREEVYEYNELTQSKLDEILLILRGQMRIVSQPLPVHNLPSLTEKVYGREEEKTLVLESLQSRKFSLVVAPSGFGKTRLLAKVLEDFTEGRTVKSEHRQTVSRLMLIDCRLTRNLTDITRELNNVLGTQLVFENRFRNYNEAWCRLVFELIEGETFIFLDNFEAWLDASQGYQLINAEIRAFLNALFASNHGLRGVVLSQSEPESDILNSLNKLREVGRKISAGLDRESALSYLRENGNTENGLADAPTELLVEFLEDVSYIPQAVNSLIGYLDSISGYSFADFMDKRNGFWTHFDEMEQDETAADKGIRRTKALIKQQILRQSDEIKVLLVTLAFFVRPVPREALELLFADKAQAANPISRLFSHNLATVTTGIRGTKYYELHAYFREQVKKLPVKFENLPTESLTGLAGSFLNKGNESFYLTYFNRAFALFELSEQIYGHLVDGLLITESANDLAGTFMNKGVALASLGRSNEAVAEYDKAIEIQKPLVEGGRGELANDLAAAYLNKGVALASLGRSNEAVAEYDKAIEIRKPLVEGGRGELANDLAMAFMNKGVALASLGRLNEAVGEYDKAIEIRKPLVESGRGELANDLAAAYLNKGVALKNLGRLNEAVAEYDKAIDIRKPLVEGGRGELANDLAKAYVNKGNALDSLGRSNEAVAEYDKAIEIQKPLVEGGRGELANELASAFMNKGVALDSLGRSNEAIAEYDKAIEIRKPLVESGRGELANDLAMAYLNKGLAYENIPDIENALIWFDEGINWREKCLASGQHQVLPDYVKDLAHRVRILIKLEDWQRTADDVINAFGFISLLESPEFPEYFKQRIIGEIYNIILHLKQTAPQNVAKIYKNAGENGKAIRELVESTNAK